MKTKTYTPTLLTLPRLPSLPIQLTPTRARPAQRPYPNALAYTAAKPAVTWQKAWAVAPLIP